MHNPILQLALEKHKYVNIFQKKIPQFKRNFFPKSLSILDPGVLKTGWKPNSLKCDILDGGLAFVVVISDHLSEPNWSGHVVLSPVERGNRSEWHRVSCRNQSQTEPWLGLVRIKLHQDQELLRPSSPKKPEIPPRSLLWTLIRLLILILNLFQFQ